MIRKAIQAKELELNNTTTQVEFDVRSAVTGTVQLTAQDQTSTVAVVTLYRSNDGFGWVVLQDGGVTLGPGNAMTDELDLSGFMLLAARVTTAEGTAQKAIVTLVYTVEQ